MTRVGIVGAGQLGRMLALAGYPIGVRCLFLDRGDDTPGAQVAPSLIGELEDPGLLAQLAGAEVESERDAIEAELRGERRHAAHLRSQVARLHQRADFSRVSLRIEAGPSSGTSGGGWGIGDAWGDAGHILGIAAGVTVIGLAVVAPLALIVLLAWLAHHLWLRTRRERALDG